jgi:hypothetical protein
MTHIIGKKLLWQWQKIEIWGLGRMIKLKKLLIKEEVDRNKLKNALKDAIDATDKLSKAVNELLNIFVRHHKNVRDAIGDPLFKVINKTINLKGKVNKLLAWKKHFAKLERKL